MAEQRGLQTSDGRGAIYDVGSDILADEVGAFMCEAAFTMNDEMLFQRYLMLTPAAQRIANRCVERMARCIKRVG